MIRCIVFSLVCIFSTAAIGDTSRGSSARSTALPTLSGFGGDFTLDSSLGRPVGLADYKGKVVLLNFGYTSCPDICPMVLNKLTRLMPMLGDSAQEVQVLFVSFDSARDSASHLKAYLEYFESRIVGFTGREADIIRVANLYKAIFIAEDGLSEVGRLYSHTDFIYLIDQKGKVRRLYSSDDRVDKIKVDIESLLAVETENKSWWSLFL